MPVDLHIRHRHRHVSAAVGDKEVGGGGPARHAQGLGEINAQLPAGGRNALGVGVVPEDGDHPGVQPQQGHVVGNVPAHTAETHPYPAGV